MRTIESGYAISSVEQLLSPESDLTYTATIVRDAIGVEPLANMAEIDPRTLKHMIGTGQLAAGILYGQGFDSSICEDGAAVGGGHDLGKADPWVQATISSTEDIGPVTRQQVRRVHCQEGENILYKIAADSLDPFQEMRVSRMAFTAKEHHSAVPEGYHDLSEEDAYRWGLTHVIKYCDVLHALWYDNRPYVRKREVELADRKPPEVVYKIILLETGGKNPIIQGREIPILSIVKDYLGLSQHYNVPKPA